MKKLIAILIAVLLFVTSNSPTSALTESGHAINPSARKILSDHGIEKLVFIRLN